MKVMFVFLLLCMAQSSFSFKSSLGTDSKFHLERYCSTLSMDLLERKIREGVIPPLVPRKAGYREVGHPKMMHGWKLMLAELNMSSTGDRREEGVDIVWETLDYTKAVPKPGVLYIYGPEFVILPDEAGIKGSGPWNKELAGHIFYTTMSDWNVRVHENMGGMPWPLISFPFAVDVEQFSSSVPQSARRGVFIYYKKRAPEMLQLVEKHLTRHSVNYTLFWYGAGERRYNETEYRQFLRTAAYGKSLA